MTTSKATTIRSRLFTSYALVTLVTAVAIGVATILISYFAGRQQAVERLESVAARKESAIRDWTHSLELELVVAANIEGAAERIGVLLDLARDDRHYTYYNGAVLNRLRGLVRQSSLLSDIFLLDEDGKVVLSTDPEEQGRNLADEPFFQRGMLGATTQLPFNTDARPGSDTVVTALPVLGPAGSVVGVIAGRADVAKLIAAMGDRTGLGDTGKSYILDQHRALLSGMTLASAESDGPRPPIVSGQGSDAAIERGGEMSGTFRDHRGTQVLGVYRWLPDQRVLLATEQDLAEAFHPVALTLWTDAVIALVALLLSGLVALVMARSLARPLGNLARTATEIANGDLTQIATVDRSDELGILAQSFNSMTAQLRDLIGTLERRVIERTDALQRRALQLETSGRVSREITSILDIDKLISEVVKLISEAFGYYRVHVFLYDETSQHLVLRSDSDGTGIEHDRLRVEMTSLNTRALQTGEPQLVNDVTQDPYYLADGGMPDTRSELVVPLRLGNRMLGTLDVNSTQVNGFTPEDVLVIRSLGDQIAIAIENARLYDRSRELAVMQERNRLARELHDSVTQSLYSVMLLTEGWRRSVQAGGGGSVYVEDYLARISDICGQALKEMRLLIYELRPPVLERDGLVGALRKRLDAVEKRSGVEARVVMDDLLELPVPVEVELYRIAQEALNNALKARGRKRGHSAHVRGLRRDRFGSGGQRSRVRSAERAPWRRDGAVEHGGTRTQDRRFAAHFVGRGAGNDRSRAGASRICAADLADVSGRRPWRPFEF